MNFSTSPDTLLPIDSNIHPRISPQLHTAPRITRSYSSSSALPTDAHAARNAFLSPPKPSSTDLATLAMPLPLCQPEPTSSSGWSDSEDDASAKPKRAVKKVKGGRPRPKIVTPLAEIVRGEQLLLGGGLRSPFEEKTELQF